MQNTFHNPSSFMEWSISNKKQFGDDEQVFNEYYYNYIKPNGFGKKMKKYFDSNTSQVCQRIKLLLSKFSLIFINDLSNCFCLNSSVFRSINFEVVSPKSELKISLSNSGTNIL